MTLENQRIHAITIRELATKSSPQKKVTNVCCGDGGNTPTASKPGGAKSNDSMEKCMFLEKAEQWGHHTVTLVDTGALFRHHSVALINQRIYMVVIRGMAIESSKKIGYKCVWQGSI